MLLPSLGVPGFRLVIVTVRRDAQPMTRCMEREG
jgi:hypothetical protein